MYTYVFPGQGSQQLGMGGSLFDEFDNLTREADEILGYSIRELCLENPDGLLDQTQYTQPALYVVNALSYYKKIREGDVAPDFLAGHSLGEFNALLAAEVFDFATGLSLVRKRGELMAQATGGGMAAVLNATPEEIMAILRVNGLTSIDLANFNTPSQTVISGRVEDIKAAQPLFQTGNHLYVVLRTSGAFHSRYMEPARAEFADFMAGIATSGPKIPVISNVTAQPYEGHLVKDLLARQIVSPVRWSDTVELLLGHPGMEFEEVGHGDVLTKLIQKIRRELPDDRPRATVPAAQPLAATPASRPTVSADELVRGWNAAHPIGTRVRCTSGDYGDLETATEATVLFGHRAAVYMRGYRGYFDINELEPLK